MQAALNGGPNLSVPAGWGDEGAQPGANAWSFGPEDGNPGMDHEDAGALYHLLENEVVPLFYDRDAEGVPKGWVEMMKAAMATVTQPFSSHRMLAEYAPRAYFPLGGLR